jgi:hypothetical protein
MRALALGGLAAFLALVAIQHLLRPDLPPAEHFVSEYARGSTRPLQVAAFLLWAASMLAGAWLAAHGGPPRRRVARAVAAGALVVAGGGALLAAVFASQTVAGELPPGVARTAAGRLHDLGTLLVLAGLVVAALASLRLVPRTGYRLTVAALGLLLLAVVPVLVALGLDAPGIGQRAFILVGCAWQWRFAASVTPPAS